MTIDNHRRLFVGTICFVLFALTLLIRTVCVNTRVALHDDEIAYSDLASALVSHKGFVTNAGQPTAWRTPGLPVLIAVLYRLNHDSIRFARLSLLAISSLTPPLTAILSFLVFDEWMVAILAGALAVLLRNETVLAGSLYGEGVASVLTLLAVIALILSLRQRPVLFGTMAGALSAAAIFVRGYLLPMGVLIPVVLLFRRRKYGRAASAFIVSAWLPLIFWTIRNAAVVGVWSLSTQPAQEIWVGNNRWARGSWPGMWFQGGTPQAQYLYAKYPSFWARTEHERTVIFNRETAIALGAYPLHIARLLPKKLAIFFGPVSYLGLDAFYLAIVLPFALIGFGDLVRRRMLDPLVLLGAPVLAVATTVVITFGDPRFRIPVDSLLVVVASHGMLRMWRTFRVRDLSDSQSGTLTWCAPPAGQEDVSYRGPHTVLEGDRSSH